VTVKTALNIDKDKVLRAAQVLGTKGTTATVDAALTEIIARDGRSRLLEYMASLPEEDLAWIEGCWDER
jgi:Arc/MetJ family transcription regulator